MCMRKASVGMYSGCDTLSLRILFVYFLALPSLLHPLIFIQLFFILVLRWEILYHNAHQIVPAPQEPAEAPTVSPHSSRRSCRPWPLHPALRWGKGCRACSPQWSRGHHTHSRSPLQGTPCWWCHPLPGDTSEYLHDIMRGEIFNWCKLKKRMAKILLSALFTVTYNNNCKRFGVVYINSCKRFGVVYINSWFAIFNASCFSDWF